jgi:hypothetical protein
MLVDHRLRPMRGLQTDRTAQTIIAGHAFMQNLRRGHHKLVIVLLDQLTSVYDGTAGSRVAAGQQFRSIERSEFATLDSGDLQMVKTGAAPSRARGHGRGARSPGCRFLALGLAWAVAVGGLGAFVRPTPASAEGTPAYKNTSLPFSVRAADLVSRMTLEEKYDQLIAMQPHATWRPKPKAIDRLGVKSYGYW